MSVEISSYMTVSRVHLRRIHFPLDRRHLGIVKIGFILDRFFKCLNSPLSKHLILIVLSNLFANVDQKIAPTHQSHSFANLRRCDTLGAAEALSKL